jgi:hypothetical protein
MNDKPTLTGRETHDHAQIADFAYRGCNDGDARARG